MSVFVSYTLKDGLVTVDKLKEIKHSISELTSCYIDIIDNDSLDKQQRVIEEIQKAKVLLILESPEVWNSNWVKTECELANKNNIPIVKIGIDKIDTIQNKLKEYEYIRDGESHQDIHSR